MNAPRGATAAFAGLPEHRQGLLAVLVAAVLWSSGGLFIKWVSLDALAITMWRSVFALVTVVIVMRPGWVSPRRADRTTWGIALTYAATLLMFVAATRLTTAASAIFLQYTAPLYLLVFGALLLGERATKVDVATVGIAFGGMALFFLGKLDAGAVAGNALGLASGVALAAMFLFLRSPKCGPRTRPQATLRASPSSASSRSASPTPSSPSASPAWAPSKPRSSACSNPSSTRSGC